MKPNFRYFFRTISVTIQVCIQNGNVPRVPNVHNVHNVPHGVLYEDEANALQLERDTVWEHELVQQHGQEQVGRRGPTFPQSLDRVLVLELGQVQVGRRAQGREWFFQLGQPLVGRHERVSPRGQGTVLESALLRELRRVFQLGMELVGLLALRMDGRLGHLLVRALSLFVPLVLVEVLALLERGLQNLFVIFLNCLTEKNQI